MPGYGDTPFGLRELKIFAADGSAGVALPFGLMMHVMPRITVAEFTVEGVVVGVSAFAAAADWEIEAGGINLAALAKLTGVSSAEVGSTPNRTLTMNADAGVEFPYLRVYGRAVGDGNDDIHCRLFRCKLTSIDGSFRRGEFWITSCAGVAVSSANGLYEFVQRETKAAL